MGWPPLQSLKLQWFRILKPVVVVPFESFQVTINLRDRYIGPELFVHHTWEPHLLGLIPQMGLEGSIAIDAGAHVGIYSLMLSRAVGPAGRAFALEPERENFQLLQRNLEINQISNVTAVNAAAGDTEREVLLRIDRVNRGNHQVVPNAGRFEVQRCSMTTIDRITAPFPDGAVGFIKIDVQGAEALVLEGMRETIARNPRLILQIEVAYDNVTSGKRLRSLGFDGHELKWETASLSRSNIRTLAEASEDLARRRPKDIDLLLSRDPSRLETLVAKPKPLRTAQPNRPV